MKEIADTIKYSGMRKAVGRKMEISGNYPMSYQGIYVDVTDLLDFRKKVNAERNVKLTVNDYIIKAVSISLQRVPIMNSAFSEDMKQIEIYESCNISVMTASERGLVAPVIKDSQNKTIFEISSEMKELVSKANAGTLTPDDYAEGTFGVTNIGKLNSFDSVPLPLPPEPAIMTACTAKKMPVVMDDDTIAVRLMMKLVIGGDHRILDGVPLAQFINSMKELLEEPAALIVE